MSSLNTQTSKNRNISLDILKIILACMVVGLHIGFLDDISHMAGYLLANGIFRISVPLFLLINGFFFYTIYKKGKTLFWLKKIFFMYIFWMIFYSYYWIDLNNLSFIHVFSTLLIGYFHLWYLAGLLGAGLLVIFLNKVSLRWIIVSIIITFVIGVTVQYAGNYHITTNPIDKILNTTPIHRNFIFLAFPFFFVGFLINKLELYKKISTYLLLFLTIVGMSFILGESYYNYKNHLKDGGFDNLASLMVISPVLFMLFMKIDIKGNSRNLALYANGIYFIHPIILFVCNKFITLDKTILTIIVIILSSIVTYFLIKKNKKIKFIL